jgi:hypothetical protein
MMLTRYCTVGLGLWILKELFGRGLRKQSHVVFIQNRGPRIRYPIVMVVGELLASTRIHVRVHRLVLWSVNRSRSAAHFKWPPFLHSNVIFQKAVHVYSRI